MKTSHKLLSPVLTAGLLLGGLTMCKPDATDRAKDAAKQLQDLYHKYQIRGGWGIFGIEAKDKSVDIYINVPQQQALDLQKMDAYSRNEFIAKNTCPPTGEAVWSTLEPEGDLIIHTRMNGNTFASVSCRTKRGINP